jgi:outer membrane receptor protein involved in Fe transport
MRHAVTRKHQVGHLLLLQELDTMLFQYIFSHHRTESFMSKKGRPKNNRRLRRLSQIVAGACLTVSSLNASPTEDLSLQELFNLQVNIGTLLSTKASNIPVSVTTITSDQIRQSGAATMLDLFEIYVPGFQYFSHFEGPMIGVRGVVADRNYKYLLLVNGVNINNKAHGGAVTEIQQMELGDIEGIDFIRGPGSVTYGAGAIGGIISLRTKQAKSAQTAINYGHLYPYRSNQYAAQVVSQSQPVELYGYLSSVMSKGDKNGVHLPMESFNPTYTKGGGMLADVNGIPLTKGHLALTVPELDLKAWARYTESARYIPEGMDRSASWYRGIAILKDSTGAPIDTVENIQAINNYNLHLKQITAAVEKKFSLDVLNGLTVTPALSYYNMNFRRQRTPRPINLSLPLDLQYIRSNPDNDYYNLNYFSENEIVAKVTSELSITEDLSAAFGIEGTRTSYRKPWGEDFGAFRMGDGSNMFSDSTSTSLYFHGQGPGIERGKERYIGDGWHTNTVSGLFEARYSGFQYFQPLVSMRLDKNDFSRYLFSPRFAAVSEINENHTVKAVVQRSVRLTTGEQLYIQHLAKELAEPEVLVTGEIMYNALIGEHISANFSTYYNDLNLIGYFYLPTPPYFGETVLLAKQKTFGGEFEGMYKFENLSIGAAYAISKQLSFELIDTARGSTGFSVADLNKTKKLKSNQTLVFHEQGNNLLNTATHDLKLFSNIGFFENKLNVHCNARLLLGYDGLQDKKEMYDDLFAQISDPVERKKYQDLFELSTDEGYLDPNFSFNATIAYTPIEWVTVQLNLLNIIKSNKNRHQLDFGHYDLIPEAMAFKEDPTSVGVQVQLKF